MRILAVDDNATNRLVLTEQLASWGVRHAEARSAAEAIDMLRAAHAAGDPFRVVLTDMQMPEMDGETLGKTLKADPELRDTLLVMMSSLGNRGDARRLKAIGFAAYLTKPVRQSQLYDCLATVLGKDASGARTPGTDLITRHTLNEARRRSVRILLAEDNATNQQVALAILEKLGFHADVVANGEEAIGALEMRPYDIVLMDVQMPVLDGLVATESIRAGTTRVLDPSIPIIAMTAHAMMGDRERCLAAGMNDYLSKPIAPQALADVLNRWLNGDQEPPATVEAPGQGSVAIEGPAVFDRAALTHRLMDDEKLVGQIIVCFLDDMPRQVQALRKAVEGGDVGLVASQAHGIKGAAANVGGMALSAVAAEMERAGRDGQLAAVVGLLPELDRQLDSLRAQMRGDTP